MQKRRLVQEQDVQSTDAERGARCLERKVHRRNQQKRLREQTRHVGRITRGLLANRYPIRGDEVLRCRNMEIEG